MMPMLKRKTLFVLSVALVATGLLTAGLASATSLAQSAQQGEALFNEKCRPCHNIGGGDLVGPDLEGVIERRDIGWLRDFILAPDRVIASGDPIASELLAKYNNLPMPNLGLSPAEVEDVLAYLEISGETSSAQSSEGILALNGDPLRGRNLFSGEAPFQNRGTSCIACHSVNGVAALGGGTLGPDLTQVVDRYQGEKAMASVMESLPFPSMQGIFTDHPLVPQEKADLLAFLVQAGEDPASTRAVDNSVWFWALGSGGALALFVVMAFFWPGQRQSISDRLRKKN